VFAALVCRFRDKSDALEWAGGLQSVLMARKEETVRGCGRIKQNVPVLEVLGFRAVLQVLLQAVTALVAADGGDGRLVDDSVSAFRCHDGSRSVMIDSQVVWEYGCSCSDQGYAFVVLMRSFVRREGFARGFVVCGCRLHPGNTNITDQVLSGRVSRATTRCHSDCPADGQLSIP
jgi:hypothetical protein